MIKKGDFFYVYLGPYLTDKVGFYKVIVTTRPYKGLVGIKSVKVYLSGGNHFPTIKDKFPMTWRDDNLIKNPGEMSLDKKSIIIKGCFK